MPELDKRGYRTVVGLRLDKLSGCFLGLQQGLYLVFGGALVQHADSKGLALQGNIVVLLVEVLDLVRVLARLHQTIEIALRFTYFMHCKLN